jgi:cytochrome bd-type quinol oxidase subunit 1
MESTVIYGINIFSNRDETSLIAHSFVRLRRFVVVLCFLASCFVFCQCCMIAYLHQTSNCHMLVKFLHMLLNVYASEHKIVEKF